MAQRAIPPGAVRRRAVFGLLDADGWSWASIKALFWFLVIIFVLGYVPDRAYYFTVSPTIDLGFNAISPINLCPADNRRLPCPAPAGSVIPWESSPAELDLPAARAGAGIYPSGENVYFVGGRTEQGATDSVLATIVFDGNFTAWQDGPALPEPRSDAAIVNLSGVPYVLGGRDAAGEPTDTVFRGTVEEGLLTGWEVADDLALPQPLADAAAAPTTTGIYLFGGESPDGPSAATYRAVMSTEGAPQLGAWQEVTELPLPEARVDARAVSVGQFIYVLGGDGPDGASNLVYFLELDNHGNPAVNDATGRPFGWGVSVGPTAAAALPEPRARHTSFASAGAIYVVGGEGPDGNSTTTNFWAVPDPAAGTIAEWQRLDDTDLAEPRAEATAAVVGQHVFVFGGSNGEQLLSNSLRADLAPRLPFFRLGLFGITIPALSIKGEIGQQLGYLSAAGVGTGAFVALIVIGWMFSHRRESYRFLERVSRGRIRAPVEDEYQL